MAQTTPFILMVEPVAFAYNIETAQSNAFQNANAATNSQTQHLALVEFRAFVEKLRQAGVAVLTVRDTPEPHTPDAIFPNNWISTESNGTLYLFPMSAKNRALERRTDIVLGLQKWFGFKQVYDLSHYEQDGRFLEGTGSLVLDRENRVAYACRSPRTDVELVQAFCKFSGYSPVIFDAFDANAKPIYHTNVMLSVGTTFAAVVSDSIPEGTEKKALFDTLQTAHKTLIELSFDQMNQFAGNMLEVATVDGGRIVAMSGRAHRALTPAQMAVIESDARIISADLTTIEDAGGGSARCMLAEIFPPSEFLQAFEPKPDLMAWLESVETNLFW